MASTVVITPLSDGTAIFELNGMTHPFPDWVAARTEAERLNLPCQVEPFPSLVPEPYPAEQPGG